MRPRPVLWAPEELWAAAGTSERERLNAAIEAEKPTNKRWSMKFIVNGWRRGKKGQRRGFGRYRPSAIRIEPGTAALTSEGEEKRELITLNFYNSRLTFSRGLVYR